MVFMVDEQQSPEFQQVEQSVQDVAQPQFYREKSIDTSEQKPSWWQRIKDFFVECERVLRITKKPDKIELKTIIKISGLGILVIGLVGFLIHLIRELLF